MQAIAVSYGNLRKFEGNTIYWMHISFREITLKENGRDHVS
jgi:hypothetical protein